MLINRGLIQGSERRLSSSKVVPAKLAKELGDRPLDMTPEQKQLTIPPTAGRNRKFGARQRCP